MALRRFRNFRSLRSVTLVAALWTLTACGQNPPLSVPTEHRAGTAKSRSGGGTFGDAPPGKPPPCPSWTDRTPEFPQTPPCVRRADGFDPEAEAETNREPRRSLPEQPGARLIEVRDAYVVENLPEGQVATGVITTWRYEVDGRSKCDLSATIEDPMGPTAGSDTPSRRPG